MADPEIADRITRRRYTVWWLVGLGVFAAATIAWPKQAFDTGRFVLVGLWTVAPLVIPGVLISAWVTASGAGGQIKRAFDGRVLQTVLVASAIGAITPVCGVTVLPLMAGLLASGVPFAPIMAFWLSSPVTDPAMLATTAATLGWTFAIAKSIAAFGIGLFGGLATAMIRSAVWTKNPLRDSGFIAVMTSSRACGPEQFRADIWRERARRATFQREALALVRLLLICLVPAFAAEHALNAVLQPNALAAYVGRESHWAIPLAVFVGAPAYVDGYAALPLTRGLVDHGMSPGAAMAFLVSGSVISIWGAMAILPVLRVRPFLLFLLLAVAGSLASGTIYGLLVK
jgi:uncharacterized protein